MLCGSSLSMPENDLVSMRRGNLRKAEEEERMRIAAWKLAALMGIVPTMGCVQKIVPNDGPPLGNGDGGTMQMDMDASMMPGPGGDAGKRDAGNPDASMSTGGLSCLTYCTEIIDSCVGAFRQYESMQQCMNMCADMP